MKSIKQLLTQAKKFTMTKSARTCREELKFVFYIDKKLIASYMTDMIVFENVELDFDEDVIIDVRGAYDNIKIEKERFIEVGEVEGFKVYKKSNLLDVRSVIDRMTKSNRIYSIMVDSKIEKFINQRNVLPETFYLTDSNETLISGVISVSGGMFRYNIISTKNDKNKIEKCI